MLLASKDSISNGWMAGLVVSARVGTRRQLPKREVEALASERACQAVARVLWRYATVPRGCLKSRNSGPAGLILQSHAVDVVDRWGSVTGGMMKRRRAIVSITINRRVRQRPSALPD